MPQTCTAAVRVMTLLFVSWAGAGVVAAQTTTRPPSRVSPPFAGLFGGGPPADNTQALDLRGSIFSLWQETRVPEETADLLGPLFQAQGVFGGASASLNYRFNRTTRDSALLFSANGLASSYSFDSNAIQYNAGAALELRTKMTRRIDFTSAATANYSPYFSFAGPNVTPTDRLQNVFDPSVNSPVYTFSLTPSSNITGLASAGLTYRVGRRTTVTTNVAAGGSFFLDTPENDLRQLNGRANVSYALSQKVALVAGYGRSIVRSKTFEGFGRDSGQTVDQIDARIDYRDALRLARRTTLTFGTSVAGITSPRDGHVFYSLVGNGALSHTLSRYWNSSLTYQRTLGFVPGFIDPLLTDLASVSVGGVVFRRLQLTSALQVNRSNLVPTDGHLLTYGATGGVTVGVTQRIGLFTQYSYFVLDNNAENSLQLVPHFSRQTVTAGLSLATTLIGNQRTR